MLLFSLNGCKSSEKIHSPHTPLIVSKHDFISLDTAKYGNAKAVLLSESLDFRIESVSRPVWRKYDEYSSDVWATTVEDKILFLSENSANDTFSRIDYPYPPDVRWDLMTKCEMWLYSMDDKGHVKNRKLKTSEIIRKRKNDSIGSVILNIKEPIKGKILLRKYTTFYPYYTQYHYKDNSLSKIKPFIFQREIPLLSGNYNFILPELVSKYYETKQLGEGHLDIQQTNSVESHYRYITTPSNSNLKGGRHIQMSTKNYLTEYKAKKVTITASNIMPLSDESNAQPLGVEIVRKTE